MVETAREWFHRLETQIEAEGLREGDLARLRSWPWDGAGAVVPLEPPGEEVPRGGEGGADCFMCGAAAALYTDYLAWTDGEFMLGAPKDEVALPVVAFLMPCVHHDLSTLPSRSAARMGELLVACELAAIAALDVPRLQVHRYGVGQEHLHWWLLGRPRGMLQLGGTFLPLWNDLLPTRSRHELRADLRLLAEHLVSLVGGRVLG